MLDKLYEIQRLLIAEMPEAHTNIGKALYELDCLIDELEAERSGA